MNPDREAPNGGNRRATMPREQIERLIEQEIPRRRTDDFAREVFYVEMTRLFRKAARLFNWWAFPLIIAIGGAVVGLGVLSALHLYWARTEYAALDSEFNRMRSEIQRLASENRDLRVSVEEVTQRGRLILAGLEEESRTLREDALTLKNETRSLQGLASSTRQKLSLYEKNIANAQDQNRIAKEAIASLDKRTQSLRKAQMHFVRYAEMALNGAGRYPDPNLKKELDALGAALDALGASQKEYDRLEK